MTENIYYYTFGTINSFHISIMILCIKPIEAKNLLWNSMAHADITQLFQTYGPLLDAVKENKLVEVGKELVHKSYSDPLLGPIIFLAIVPIVLSIIGLILCLFVNVPVCYCGRYLRYMKTQKKLDKLLVRFIKTNDIPYDFSPPGKKRRDTMFDACAETNDLEECDQIDELNKMHEKADGLYLKAFPCQCCPVIFYAIFFALMFVYIITMFYLSLGAKSITQLPITMFTSVQSVSKSVGGQLLDTFGSIDKSVNALTGNSEKPIPLFVSLMNGTEQQYADNFNKVQTQALELIELKPLSSSLNALLERNNNTSLTNQKSLARWLENLLFWPESQTAEYVVNGNNAGKMLHNNIYDMNNDVYKIGKNINYITGNMTDFPDEIKKNVPVDTINDVDLKNISEMISSTGSGNTQNQDLVDVLKLLEKKELNKYVFANALINVVKNQAGGQINITNDMIQVFINKTLVGKTLQNVDRKTPLYNIMEPLLGADVLNLLDGEALLEQLSDMLNSSGMFVSLQTYQPYLAQLNKLQNLTVDEFLEQLSSKQCSDFWCGILPEGTFQKINDMLKKVPVVGNMLAYKNGPSELLQNSQPLVIAICTLIPIIVIISLTISMACCKSCCPICAMFGCSICSLIVSIISLVLLIVSFVNSGVIQSVSYKMEKDNEGLINSALTIGKQIGVIKQESITLSLPSSSMLTIEPSQLTIPLTNVQDILKSINFTISLNTQAGGNQTDFMSILLPNGFSLTVSLDGMDINKLFSGGKSRSILQLIKGQNGTLLDDIKAKLGEVVDSINTESISRLFGDALNITSKFNINQILDQINISQIFDELNKKNFSSIQQQLDSNIKTIKGFIVQEPPQNENEILFNKVTAEMNQSIQNSSHIPNVSNLIDIKINGTTNLNLLDQVYLNLILQFLSEKTGFDQITNVTKYYQDAFIQVQQRNYTVYDDIQSKYCGNNDEFNNFGTLYQQLDCSKLTQQPPIISPDFNIRYAESIKNRNLTDTTNNCTACKVLMCQVTKTLMEADIFNYKNDSSAYKICDVLTSVKKLRTAVVNIETSIENVKGSLDQMIESIDNKVPTSFASTAQTNLQIFFNSIFSNIDQTTQLMPIVPITTIYDVLTNSEMISNIQTPLELVKDQLVSLCQNVISTGFTNIIPSSISTLGNGMLGGFDSMSVTAYFGFIFYFVGCQICICFSLQLIRRCNYERYIKKHYQVIRPRFNFCGNAFHTLDTFKQTKHDYIESNNYLSVREGQLDEDCMILPCDESGLVLTPAVQTPVDFNPTDVYARNMQVNNYVNDV